jgi:heme exporter protein A
MIKLVGILKTFGLLPVLRGINLEVGEGEFVGLVGPNGAGKSTLMRIVATLSNPTDGQISIGGWPIPQHAEQVRRHIGLVSHQPLLYGDLTALENLLFFGRIYQLDRPLERAKEALQEVGLWARQNDQVRTFSRGMTQRLTIARATLHQPDVLLLDEPYTGLDQDASRMLDNLLRRESAKGRTIFMITHDLAHGLNLCQRVAILHRGKIAREMAATAVTAAEFMAQYQEITGGQKQTGALYAG